MNSAFNKKPAPSRFNKGDLQSWSIPYGRLQADFLIWKFKQLFPNELLADRIKNWPKHTSIALKEDFPNFDLESSNEAALKHQNERQLILNKMKHLIIRENLSSMSPLQKLEAYEEMKYQEFKNEMKGNFRLMRKYFPWLLKKRVYKSKKRHPDKIKRQNAKRKLKKQLQKKTREATSASHESAMPPESWPKCWHPVQPPCKIDKRSYNNKPK